MCLSRMNLHSSWLVQDLADKKSLHRWQQVCSLDIKLRAETSPKPVGHLAVFSKTASSLAKSQENPIIILLKIFELFCGFLCKE